MGNRTIWHPYEELPLEEKILIVSNAIRELAKYTGAIARAMIKQKRQLLERLQAEKAKRDGTCLTRASSTTSN